MHKDAVEGADYDLQNLTQVWRTTNGQENPYLASLILMRGKAHQADRPRVLVGKPR